MNVQAKVHVQTFYNSPCKGEFECFISLTAVVFSFFLAKFNVYTYRGVVPCIVQTWNIDWRPRTYVGVLLAILYSDSRSVFRLGCVEALVNTASVIYRSVHARTAYSRCRACMRTRV